MKVNRTYQDLSRRDIRSLIFQILYALESHNDATSIESIVESINRGYQLDIPLDSEVVQTTQAILDEQDSLDDAIKPLLKNWRFERISVPAKLILRFALWELQQKKLDPNIVLNEAVELAKCFAEQDAYKFINGVLDEYVKETRSSG